MKGKATALCSLFFFQAEDGIRDYKVTGVQTCALPISADRPDSGPSAQCRCPAGPCPWTHSPRSGAAPADRKSTRLNSSHLVISYAVFCLKKKKKHEPHSGSPLQRPISARYPVHGVLLSALSPH